MGSPRVGSNPTGVVFGLRETGAQCHLEQKTKCTPKTLRQTLAASPAATPEFFACKTRKQQKIEDSGAKSRKSGHPESNQGPSDGCECLQSDALPTEL